MGEGSHQLCDDGYSQMLRVSLIIIAIAAMEASTTPTIAGLQNSL
jgi:hypothetical protein